MRSKLDYLVIGCAILIWLMLVGFIRYDPKIADPAVGPSVGCFNKSIAQDSVVIEDVTGAVITAPSTQITLYDAESNTVCWTY